MNNKEMVNHPSHYNQGDIECIDAMVSAFGEYSTAEFCKINAFKYLWRLGHKDDETQEIGKIKWYLDKYLELTKPPIGVRLDTGEPVFEEPMIVWKGSPTLTEGPNMRLLNKSELKQNGLTDREAENILNK